MDPHNNNPTGEHQDQNPNNQQDGGTTPTDGGNGGGDGGNAGADNGLDFDLDTFDPATATPEQVAQLKEYAAKAKNGYETYKGRYKSTKSKQQKQKSPQSGDLESIVDSKVNEAIQQTNFWQNNPDAVEYKDKITSTAKEKNLSLEEATKLVMFDIKTDPGYVARQRGTATAVHGSTSPSKDKKGPMSSIVGKTPGFIAKMRQQKEASKN